MNVFAGKQKALLAAIGAFVASLILKLSTGGDISDMANDPATSEMALLIADLAQSAVIAIVTYIAAYLKANVAADGTEMKFVKPSGVVVDTGGAPTGEKVG